MLSNRVYSAALRHTPIRSALLRQPHLWTSQVISQTTFRPAQRQLSSARLLAKTQPIRTSSWRSRPLRRVRHSSDKPTSNAAQAAGDPTSISGRFKQLSRKYGWAAVGVYLALSVLDFPFCFLAVRLIGPDRIGEAEHAIVHGFWNLVGMIAPSMRPDKASVQAVESDAREAGFELDGQKVKENASIWTQLLLAYGVHKSLIFFRVPLTAAVTPKVVKTLRSWGYNIGPRVKAPRA